MNLNHSSAYMIRIVPEPSEGELRVSMTAVADGTRTKFAAPAESWEDCAKRLKDTVGIKADSVDEAAEKLQRGSAAKVEAKCFVTEITQLGFELVHR